MAAYNPRIITELPPSDVGGGSFHIVVKGMNKHQQWSEGFHRLDNNERHAKPCIARREQRYLEEEEEEEEKDEEETDVMETKQGDPLCGSPLRGSHMHACDDWRSFKCFSGWGVPLPKFGPPWLWVLHQKSQSTGDKGGERNATGGGRRGIYMIVQPWA
ncbi:unnamed protein product [Prorocentrum cordatum]|uniref:Uncharacterized protein n=1 Tax=Prorocentrum cordatum TaxID=2364126 RepID=A0ABN9XCJ9_9DINO|nr:unnamed protein product [Polarella glacialis]